MTKFLAGGTSLAEAATAPSSSSAIQRDCDNPNQVGYSTGGSWRTTLSSRS